MAKRTDIEILAPATGKVLPLCETKDEVFSAGTMGQGFGLEPSAEGEIEVVAPVSGTVMMLADTKHAIGIQTADGLEILIHMGIDTVNLKGTPFTVHCEQGSTVKAGEPIATMNLKEIEAHKLAKTIIVIVTNSADKLESLSLDEGEIQAGEPAADAHLKGAGKKKKGKRDYDALATTIIKLVGGKENVNNLIHCITRLRFYLKDESKADTEALKNTDGVIDVMKASGQYQVVIGNEVTNVFDAVMKQLGPLDEDAAAAQPAENDGKNPISRAFGNLIGFITGSMSPVIGVIAAYGIIKGILAPQLGSILSVKSTMYMTVSAMADSAFFFLPILVGYSAAKRLGSDPIVAAVIGGVLTYPQIITWGKAFKTMFTIGGFHFQFLNYTYSIFPMIVAAWLAKKVGDWLKDHLPSYLQMIFNPLITILVVSTITLVITGPIILGFSSFFNPAHPTQLTSFYAFLLSSIAAIIVSFLVTWFWGYNDNMSMGKKVEKKKRPGTK